MYPLSVKDAHIHAEASCLNGCILISCQILYVTWESFAGLLTDHIGLRVRYAVQLPTDAVLVRAECASAKARLRRSE